MFGTDAPLCPLPGQIEMEYMADNESNGTMVGTTTGIDGVVRLPIEILQTLTFPLILHAQIPV
jgi:hypothetical protein